MNLVLHGSVPGVPRTPLVTLQEKVSPEMVSKKQLGLWESLGAHCHLSAHSPLCPQPGVSGFKSHVGSSTLQPHRPQAWP